VYRSTTTRRADPPDIRGTAPDRFSRLVSLGALYEETGEVDKGSPPTCARSRVRPEHRRSRSSTLSRPGRARIGYASTSFDPSRARTTRIMFSSSARPLIQRGDASARYRSSPSSQPCGDEEALARVAEFYERVEESKNRLPVSSALDDGARRSVAPGRSRPIASFSRGQEEGPSSTWIGSRFVYRPSPKALASLGEVLLDPRHAGRGGRGAPRGKPAQPSSRVQEGLRVALAATHVGRPIGGHHRPSRRGPSCCGKGSVGWARANETSPGSRRHPRVPSSGLCNRASSILIRLHVASPRIRRTSTPVGSSPMCQTRLQQAFGVGTHAPQEDGAPHRRDDTMLGACLRSAKLPRPTCGRAVPTPKACAAAFCQHRRGAYRRRGPRIRGDRTLQGAAPVARAGAEAIERTTWVRAFAGEVPFALPTTMKASPQRSGLFETCGGDRRWAGRRRVALEGDRVGLLCTRRSTLELACLAERLDPLGRHVVVEQHLGRARASALARFGTTILIRFHVSRPSLSPCWKKRSPRSYSATDRRAPSSKADETAIDFCFFLDSLVKFGDACQRLFVSRQRAARAG